MDLLGYQKKLNECDKIKTAVATNFFLLYKQYFAKCVFVKADGTFEIVEIPTFIIFFLKIIFFAIFTLGQ